METKYIRQFIIGSISFIFLLSMSCQSTGKQGLNSQKDSIGATEISGEQAITAQVTDSIRIDGSLYTLYQEGKTASLQVTGAINRIQGELQLEAPVFFIRKDQSEEILSFVYPDFKVEKIIMLAGGTLDSLEKTKHGIDPSFECGTHIQGLVLNNQDAILGKTVLAGIRCKGYSSDEKDYYSLAEGFFKEQ